MTASSRTFYWILELLNWEVQQFLNVWSETGSCSQNNQECQLRDTIVVVNNEDYYLLFSGCAVEITMYKRQLTSWVIRMFHFCTVGIQTLLWEVSSYCILSCCWNMTGHILILFLQKQFFLLFTWQKNFWKVICQTCSNIWGFHILLQECVVA